MLPAPPSTGSSTPPLGIVIGLGANLGSPEAQMRSAVRALEQRALLLRVSSLYASAPIGPEQPDFLNAAVLVKWQASLFELFELTRELEAELGRKRSTHWGPRVIDLDLLWAGETTVAAPLLTVPHLELTKRAFALVPLLELCPEATVPGTGVGYRSFLPDVRSQRIKRTRGTDWWELPTASGP